MLFRLFGDDGSRSFEGTRMKRTGARRLGIPGPCYSQQFETPSEGSCLSQLMD